MPRANPHTDALGADLSRSTNRWPRLRRATAAILVAAFVLSACSGADGEDAGSGIDDLENTASAPIAAVPVPATTTPIAGEEDGSAEPSEAVEESVVEDAAEAVEEPVVEGSEADEEPVEEAEADEEPVEEAEADEEPVLEVRTNTLIQLIDPHDEPEYYCVDVRGVGATLDINAALTAHTCKPGFDDELFNINDPGPGQLFMPAYDRCVEATAAEVNVEVFIVECSPSSLQRFTFLDDQTIRLTDHPTLCLGVGDSPGEPTGGPSHLRRLLRMYSCDEHPRSLSAWITPGPTLG